MTTKSNVSFWGKWGSFLTIAASVGIFLLAFPTPFFTLFSSDDSDEAENIRRHGTYSPSVAQWVFIPGSGNIFACMSQITPYEDFDWDVLTLVEYDPVGDSVVTVTPVSDRVSTDDRISIAPHGNGVYISTTHTYPEDLIYTYYYETGYAEPKLISDRDSVAATPSPLDENEIELPPVPFYEESFFTSNSRAKIFPFSNRDIIVFGTDAAHQSLTGYWIENKPFAMKADLTPLLTSIKPDNDDSFGNFEIEDARIKNNRLMIVFREDFRNKDGIAFYAVDLDGGRPVALTSGKMEKACSVFWRSPFRWLDWVS